MTILIFPVLLHFGISCDQRILWLLTVHSVKCWLFGLDINPVFNLHVRRELNCKCSHKWLDFIPLLGLQTLMWDFFYFFI